MSVCWVVKARKEQGQEGNKGMTACRSDKNPGGVGCLQEDTGAGTGSQARRMHIFGYINGHNLFPQKSDMKSKNILVILDSLKYNQSLSVGASVGVYLDRQMGRP